MHFQDKDKKIKNQNDKKTTKNLIAKRKQKAKKWRRLHKGEPMNYFNGILYLTKFGQPISLVAGAERFPKYGVAKEIDPYFLKRNNDRGIKEKNTKSENEVKTTTKKTHNTIF